jgi:hypothetical protein
VKKNISDDQFTDLLKEVCFNRFGNKVSVIVEKNKFEGEIFYNWEIQPTDKTIKKPWMYSWQISRQSKRKFGGKHPWSTWGFWMMCVIQNELAVKLNGKITDEGVSGSWNGDLDKYTTFKNYLNSRFKHIGSKKIQKLLIFAEKKSTPKPLLDL